MTIAADPGSGAFAGPTYGLRVAESAALARWLEGKAGDDRGREWWPRAIRRLPISARLEFATTHELDRAWEERERVLTRELRYLIAGYGSVEGGAGAGAVPFDLWPFQERTVEILATERLAIFLKARQQGLTTLCLHAGLHLMAFDPETPAATILALSKKGEDASKLVTRFREIIKRLPSFLRPAEDASTRGSKTEMVLAEGGRILSLMGSPDAARSEPSVAAVIMDEFAFIRNGMASETLTAALPTIGDHGRLWVVSTGNGRVGDGEAFSEAWTAAREGKSDFAAQFIRSSEHPGRDEAWRERTRSAFLADEDFVAEYPETEDEAFMRPGGQLVLPAAGIDAAVRLGRELRIRLDARELQPQGGRLWHAIDWGDFASGIYVVWPLPRGGVYIPPSEVTSHREEVSEIMLRAIDRAQLLGFPCEDAHYDAAGASEMRTAVAAARKRGIRLRTKGVPFGGKVIGQQGPKSYKFEGIRYLRHLFRRAAAGETSRIIAIDPENTLLIEQLRVWRWREDRPDEIDKGNDEGPDALTAGTAVLATAWRAAGAEDSEDQ